MKKTAGFLAVLLMVIIKAQSVSDYQYVMIPAEFSTFRETYGMDAILNKSLTFKKYMVLPAEKSTWPADAVANPCKILSADVLNEKSLLRNKISLQFRDCNQKVIYSEKASSMIKEFEPGFQDAMRQAIAKLPAANPKSMVTESVAVRDNIVSDTAPSQQKVVESKPAGTAQRYSNGNLTLQKIQIDDSQFILVDSNSSTPFATFKKTAKNDVFRVKLNSGESTLGYFENGNIVIEMPKGSDFVNEVFKAQ